jgi:thiamine-phosphate pyrophosphorylase
MSKSRPSGARTHAASRQGRADARSAPARNAKDRSADRDAARGAEIPALPPCRIYLVTPAQFEPAGFAAQFAAALDGGDVASLLVALESEDETVWRRALDEILSVAQPHDVAVLLAERVELAAATETDGVHVEGGRAALEAALRRLKPDKIVGAGRLRTRHDAMTAAEAGADYVLFGSLDAPFAPERQDELAERVAWWAELFEVPCVAAADSLQALGALARAGADFVALRDAVWAAPDGPAAAVRQANEQIRIERTA